MKSKILFFILAVITIAACSKDNSGTNSASPTAYSNGGTGQGGSLARFTIAADHLYVVDGEKLYAYSLANAAAPQLKATVYVGFNIETIYSYRDRLFIGSQDAMYVYSLDNPASPSKLGQASHVRACDPVVANDSMAYVTVRGSSACGGTANELITYDIRNVLSPVRRSTVPMSSPYGLGIKDKRLYVCNGAAGLSIFSLKEPHKPWLVNNITGETFYDVIVDNNLLICMIKGGTALYEISANDQLNKLATITN